MTGTAEAAGGVVILVPMLGRAHRIAPLLESIRATSDAAVLFLVSPHDDGVQTAVRAAGQPMLRVDWRPYGDYARKINAGVRATREALVFTGADDLLFHPGWLEAALAKLAPGIGVIGTNDLGSPRVMAGQHATHCLITRAYIEKFGVIDGPPGQLLYEEYVHEYVDDELVGTAKSRAAFAMAMDSYVEHLHPNWGKAEVDALYAEQQNRMRQSRHLYLMRRRLWTT